MENVIGRRVRPTTDGANVAWSKIIGKVTDSYQNDKSETMVSVYWSEEIANNLFGRSNLVLGSDVALI